MHNSGVLKLEITKLTSHCRQANDVSTKFHQVEQMSYFIIQNAVNFSNEIISNIKIITHISIKLFYYSNKNFEAA